MSPPTSSLALRSAHPALAMWWEELRHAESRNDARAELSALNAVLKTYGVPPAAFGRPAAVPVGMIVLRRAELLVLGLHRHFFSEACYSLQGVESLLLLGDEPQCEDGGDRLVYAGCGRTEAQLQASLAALRANAKARRAVRVVRAVAAAELDAEEEAACAPDAARGGPRFRYDGLYYVQRDGADMDEDGEPRFVLQRAPGQPPLPASAARGGKRQRTDAEHEPGVLSLGGELAGRGASAELPEAAEVLLSGQDTARERLTVPQALAQLRAARDELLAALAPREAYVLARRSVLNQVRVRSALELLHDADGRPGDPHAWHPLGVGPGGGAAA